MADPTPAELDARLKAVEAEQVAHDGRIKALEEDDAKVHGFIQWINEKIVNNPKMAVAITTALGLLAAWVMARLNALPGVVSEPTPIVKPADSKLDQLQKNLKEQAK